MQSGTCGSKQDTNHPNPILLLRRESVLPLVDSGETCFPGSQPQCGQNPIICPSHTIPPPFRLSLKSPSLP